MQNIFHLWRLWNFLWNIISISNIQLIITHREMDWLNLPTKLTLNHQENHCWELKGLAYCIGYCTLGFRVTPRNSLGTSPYFLVYGKEAILHPNINLPSLHLTQSSHGRSSNFLQTWIDTLLKLKEEINKAKEKIHIHHERIKRWLDKHVVGDKQFQVGDLVLKWDKTSEARAKYFKIQEIWLGLYEIAKKIGDATYKLKYL